MLLSALKDLFKRPIIIDTDEMADYISEKLLIERNTVLDVLEYEEEFLKEKGVIR